MYRLIDAMIESVYTVGETQVRVGACRTDVVHAVATRVMVPVVRYV